MWKPKVVTIDTNHYLLSMQEYMAQSARFCKQRTSTTPTQHSLATAITGEHTMVSATIRPITTERQAQRRTWVCSRGVVHDGIMGTMFARRRHPWVHAATPNDCCVVVSGALKYEGGTSPCEGKVVTCGVCRLVAHAHVCVQVSFSTIVKATAEHLFVHQLGAALLPTAVYGVFDLLGLDLWARMLAAWPYSEKLLLCILLTYSRVICYAGNGGGVMCRGETLTPHVLRWCCYVVCCDGRGNDDLLSLLSR